MSHKQDIYKVWRRRTAGTLKCKRHTRELSETILKFSKSHPEDLGHGTETEESNRIQTTVEAMWSVICRWRKLRLRSLREVQIHTSTLWRESVDSGNKLLAATWWSG